MESATAHRQMCEYCFEVLIKTLEGRKEDIERPRFTNDEFPLFVTWNKQSNRDPGTYRLRGCIGTFLASPLRKTLKRYALTSALEDHRFAPVALNECSRLQCTVSLLVQFERASDPFDWEIGKHGIRIFFEHPDGGRQYSATYLPDVCADQGWTKHECLDSLIRKAGYRGKITQRLLQRLELERYQSSKFTLTYDEYVNGVEHDTE